MFFYLILSSCYFPLSSTCSISYFHLPQLSLLSPDLCFSLLYSQFFLSLPFFFFQHHFTIFLLSFSPFFSLLLTISLTILFLSSPSYFFLSLFLFYSIFLSLHFSPYSFSCNFSSLPYFFFHLDRDFFYPSYFNFIPSFSYFLYTIETEFKKN